LSNISDGSIEVKNGIIKVINPTADGKAAVVFASANMNMAIDGKVVKGKCEVFSTSTIEVILDSNEASRHLDIEISEDAMEAWISITYEPKVIYKLTDKAPTQLMQLEYELIDKKFPPKYKKEEILKQLSENKIVYGIIESNLEKCVENEVKHILIAKGLEVVDGISDNIQLKFESEKETNKFKEDETGNVDFKNIGAVVAVKKDEVIAIKVPGAPGVDGTNIKGKVIKTKNIKKVDLRAGKGCIIKEGTKVVAIIDGKPWVKNNVFYVYQIHEVKSDVDLSTGNINFIGDINILGGVTEGMEIVSGNSVKINKDVEGARIIAKGDVKINGNVLRSKVYCGGEDVSRLNILKNLESLKMIIETIQEAVRQIKDNNILSGNKNDGDLIKLLIEGKYKNLTMICIKVITEIPLLQDEEKSEELINLIRQKLLGLAPLSIKNYGELDQVVNIINTINLKIKSELSLPVSINLGYCQDSVIKSSGDIIFTGKGEYISDIVANGSIKFLRDKSVARGGTLRAASEINCKIVGSSAGVSTKLQTNKEGNIFVEVAFQNTIFILGQKEYMLDKPSKSIHAYTDPSGDIIMEKLLLEV